MPVGEFTHYLGLGAGYALAIAGSLGVAAVVARRGTAAGGPGAKPLYPAVDAAEFRRPWLEFALAVAACAAIVGAGQLYVLGWLLPADGPLGWLAEAVNQFLIFSPIVALLLIRRGPVESVFLTADRWPLRLGIGIAAGTLGTAVYGLTMLGPGGLPQLLDSFLSSENVAHGVQVLMEDVVIICLITRLAAGLRSMVLAGVIVVGLFVAGHVPTILATEGLTLTRLAQLGLDCAIGALVLIGLLRLRDLLWFWPLHTCMDLTQFVEAGAAV